MLKTQDLAVRALGALTVTLALLAPTTSASPPASPLAPQEKVLNLPMRTTGPGSMDPVRGSTVYDNRACSMTYETLVQYKYLARPSALEPLLLVEMPQISEDGLTYSFKLRDDVVFEDDECFATEENAEGKGRKMVTDDVFYSWKRMADTDNDPKSWWLLEDTILGFDDYRTKQNEAEKFDYDVRVPGLVKVSDTEFKVILSKPVYRFMWVLAMFQVSVVPREAVEHYGSRFGRHPVGTGPYTMDEDDWVINKSMVFERSPSFRKEFYPTEHMPEDVEHGLADAAGKQLPFCDVVNFHMTSQDQTMWLNFRSAKLDYTQVPAENYSEVFHKRSKKLRKSYGEEGIRAVAVPLLDFIFRGINMEDDLLGGYTPERKALRQAISLAVDLEEFNDTFYNSTNIVYDGMIPPALDGHPDPDDESVVSYMGPDIERAKELMVKAGYPNGDGLPVIDYYVSQAGNSAEQSELMKRQLERIGIRLNVRLVTFAQLISATNTKKAPIFSFAWSSDYPDGENNLALFYGPNESPGSNHYNYKNAAYDKLYEQIKVMGPSPERTAIYNKMRNMVVEDVPYVGAMARTRNYLINPWLKNFKPSEDFYNWPKYLDLDESNRRK
jgi:oligopeptide transport system substrate-binding protein